MGVFASAKAEEATPEPEAEPDNRLPGALESSEGVSPELVTHGSVEVADRNELSPEERAIHGIEVAPSHEHKIEEDPAATQVAEAKEQG